MIVDWSGFLLVIVGTGLLGFHSACRSPHFCNPCKINYIPVFRAKNQQEKRLRLPEAAWNTPCCAQEPQGPAQHELLSILGLGCGYKGTVPQTKMEPHMSCSLHSLKGVV